MSICLSRLRDTRIEEDSDNSTSYEYLLVRNVFENLFAETWSTKCGYNKVIREKESNPQNIPHEEVFRGMQILWIDIESRIASAIRATKYEMLFERSEFIEWFEEFVYRPPSQDVLGITFFFDQLAVFRPTAN